MPSAGGGLPRIEDDDLVGVVEQQGRRRHDDGGAPGAVRPEPLSDPGLGVRVDGRGRLDEDEDLRVGGERAHEDESLPLPAGEAAAALVETALPAAGQRVEDVLAGCRVEGELGLRAGQAAEGVDRVAKGAGEDLGRRVADEDAAPDRVERYCGQVDPADGDSPRLPGAFLVAAGLGLARPRPLGAFAAGGPALELLGDLLADERSLVGGQVPAETVREGGRVVGHRRDDHRQQAGLDDRAGGLVDDGRHLGEGSRLLRLDPRRALAEDGDRLAGRDDGADPLLGELDERAHRVEQEQAVAEEADELPEGEAALRDLAGAEPHEGDDEPAGEQDADRLDRGEPGPREDAGVPDPLRLLRVVAAEGVLAADAPQDPQARDDVGRHRGQL